MTPFWTRNYPPHIPPTIEDTQETLQDLIRIAAERFGPRTAFVCMDQSLNFTEVYHYAKAFANYCRDCLHLVPGERVALMLPNLLEYPLALFGAQLAGLVIVNLNPLDKADALLHELTHSGATLVVALDSRVEELSKIIEKTAVKQVILTSAGALQPLWKRLLIDGYLRYIKKSIPLWNATPSLCFRELLREGARLAFQAVPRRPQDLAFIQYTSGTTGLAKGAMLSQQNVMSNLSQIHAWVRPNLTDGSEIILTALPLYHIFSLVVNCLLFVKLGGKNVLIPDPRNLPALIKIMKHTPLTCITGVNTLFNALLHQPAFCRLDHSRLKLTIGGGMAVQRAVAEAWQETTQSVLLQGYGLTETSPVVSINPLNSKSFTGSIGLPIPSTDIVICDPTGEPLPQGQVGELCVRGPQVMLGYFNAPEATQKVLIDGWLHTGDAAYIDEQGFLYLVDRLKDMLIVSGFKVYPAEVENLLKTLAGVNEVAVIGIPDALHGEVVKAFIVKEAKSMLTEQAVIDFAHARLVAYKVPHHVEFIRALPKNSVGKILKKDLPKETPPAARITDNQA
jgi:long-chain acyl-CoA synthetase